ncbi:hypothetical protein F4678DRAFT_391966 [Xylaria arbuscula]|nr:hypothetical protein F4678DRAFT_391966 [Xylaria arbuscula]
MHFYPLVIMVIASIGFSNANTNTTAAGTNSTIAETNTTTADADVSTNVSTADWMIHRHNHPLDCWTYGERFDASADLAQEYSRDVCNNTFGDRFYTLRQRAVACYNIGVLKRVDFSVELMRFPTRFLTVEECVVKIMPIAANCQRGGRRKFHDWRFIADPNRGLCG